MPAAPRRDRNSSSGSSDDSSSEDDDIPSTTFAGTSTTNELTLKDDEDTINFQPPLPEDFGKRVFFLFNKY